MRQAKLISVGDKDSFAVEDLKSQAERVINFVLDTNKLTLKQKHGLHYLQRAVLLGKAIDCLTLGSDKQFWHKIMKLDLPKKRNWSDDFHHGLTISYFHRQLLDKLEYLNTKKDPYQRTKQGSFMSFTQTAKSWPLGDTTIETIISGMLWGNKFDLIPPIISDEKILLRDDTNDFKDFLFKSKPSMIDIIADNYGEEFFFDLLFLDFLFRNKFTKKVRYHVKNCPYNISDTTKEDFLWAINYLLESNIVEMKTLGDRINNLTKLGCLEIISYPFTTLGLDRQLATNVIRKQFKGSKLIVTKGDFNYRKNVGWHYWSQSEDYNKAISYFPAPMLCLRTIKNEILLGLGSNKITAKLDRLDKTWWKKGIGGMIAFSFPDQKSKQERHTVDSYWAKNI